jgi:hypothetical protein
VLLLGAKAPNEEDKHQRRIGYFLYQQCIIQIYNTCHIAAKDQSNHQRQNNDRHIHFVKHTGHKYEGQ